MPRFIMVFTSFDAVILPLENSGEVEQRDRHVCTRVVVAYNSRREQRGAVVQSGLTQNLTSNFLVNFFGSLCIKNYNSNPQTYV